MNVQENTTKHDFALTFVILPLLCTGTCCLFLAGSIPAEIGKLEGTDLSGAIYGLVNGKAVNQ